MSDINNYLRQNTPDYQYGEFIDRELSWIDFYYRVLECTHNKIYPINEKWKFLAITSSNLYEFMGVRFSSVINTGNVNVYDELLSKISKFVEDQNKVFISLAEKSKKHGLIISKPSDLNKHDKEKLRKKFMMDIFPILTPISIINEIPNIASAQSCIAVLLEGEEQIISFIPIHDSIERLLYIGDHVLMIEDIIKYFINEIFINRDIRYVSAFKIIKDLNIVLKHDESKFIIDRMNETLLERKFSKPILLITDYNISKEFKKILLELFDLNKDRHIPTNILGYTRFMNMDIEDSSFSEFKPKALDVAGEHHSIFSRIKSEDILLHHPYDSYDTILKFIEHGSVDPKVLSIKMTLYRVSSIDSPIVNSLINAAKNGKHVTVLIEIKARFDEDRNLSLIDKLRNGGVNVILGLEYMKTHCKMCIITRKEDDGVRIYSHIGTGNYNEKTARIYTDISYLTAKRKMGMDLSMIFNLLSGMSSPNEKLNKLFYAPVNLRSQINKLIDTEIENVKNGGKGFIFLKLNSLSETEIVNKLYVAAAHGVKIYIICRGVCSIVATKNIYIKSVVGRFLEHSRIYYFHNNNKPKYFISSADLLERNLDRRVEILAPITNKKCINRLDDIISILVEDRENSFIMNKDGSYIKDKSGFNSHEWFIMEAESGISIKIPKKKKLK